MQGKGKWGASAVRNEEKGEEGAPRHMVVVLSEGQGRLRRGICLLGYVWRSAARRAAPPSGHGAHCSTGVGVGACHRVPAPCAMPDTAAREGARYISNEGGEEE